MNDEENLSPAERYARAKKNKPKPSLESFTSLLEFPLDPFQEQACHALADGNGVLVAAPTGAGKTIVGEFAIHLAIEQNLKVFTQRRLRRSVTKSIQNLSSAMATNELES